MRLIVAGTYAEVNVREDKGYYYISWKWLNPRERQMALQAEIKGMQGATWMPYRARLILPALFLPQ